MTPRPAAPLQSYVALLRAINVGGHVVKMDRLRAEFVACGLRDVTTFIASGNVLFASPATEPSALEQRIERRLERSLGYAVSTFLRTPEELRAAVTNDPFADRDESCTLQVGFLKATLPTEQCDRLLALRTEVDEFVVRGREAFWLCRARFSDSTVSAAKMTKALGMPVTFRNVTTVRKLAAKLAAPAA